MSGTDLGIRVQKATKERSLWEETAEEAPGKDGEVLVVEAAFADLRCGRRDPGHLLRGREMMRGIGRSKQDNHRHLEEGGG